MKKQYYKTICEIWQDKSDTCIDTLCEGSIVSIIKTHNDKIHLTVYTTDKVKRYDTWILVSVFNTCCIPVKTMGRVKS